MSESELKELREKRKKLDNESRIKNEIKKEKERIAKHSPIRKVFEVIDNLWDKL